MKVLHIIDTFWLGGAQSLLKSYFESEKNNLNIYLYSLRSTIPSILIEHNNVCCYNSSSRYSLGPLLALRTLIRKENIEVLHCHLPRSQIFGYLVKRLFNPNIVLIFHDHGDIYEKGVLLPLLLRIFQPQVDQFIACSKGVKEKLKIRAKLAGTRIKVIYNFVDAEKLAPRESCKQVKSERDKLGIQPDDFVVGFAGRLVERKGWREFIKIACHFKTHDIGGQSKRKVKFLIAGIGPDAEKMKKLLAELQLQDTVIYLGYAANMKSFYSLLNCLVIPSHWEGHPVTQLEALALGIPVVCSSSPGLTEITTDNIDVLYARPKDIQMFCAKIDLLASDTGLRDKLSSSGVETAMRFNLSKFSASLNKLYDSSSWIKRFKRKTVDFVT